MRVILAWGDGSEVWNQVYIIAPVRPSQEIWPSETEYQFSFKINMAENADMPEDDEFLLGFKFYGVRTSKKGFPELF